MTSPMPVPSTAKRSALWGHALAGVVDGQHHVRPQGLHLDTHRALGPVVLDGVGEQVDQDLAQPHLVGANEQLGVALALRQRHLELRGLVGHHGERLLQGVANAQGFERERQAACFDAREIEHIGEHGQQVRARLFDVAHLLFLRIVERLARIDPQQLRKAQHGVERGAQLVAHAREELGLGLAGALGRLCAEDGLLVAFALADVFDHGHEVPGLAVHVAHQHGIDLHPHRVAHGHDVALVHGVAVLVAVEGGLHQGQGDGQVIWVGDVLHVQAQHVGARALADVGKALVGVEHMPIRCHAGNAHACGFEDLLVVGLVALQAVLHLGVGQKGLAARALQVDGAHDVREHGDGRLQSVHQAGVKAIGPVDQRHQAHHGAAVQQRDAQKVLDGPPGVWGGGGERQRVLPGRVFHHVVVQHGLGRGQHLAVERVEISQHQQRGLRAGQLRCIRGQAGPGLGHGLQVQALVVLAQPGNEARSCPGELQQIWQQPIEDVDERGASDIACTQLVNQRLHRQ
jgi:hypothetical protein